MTVVDKQVTEGPTKTHQRRDIAIDEALGAFLARRRAEQERYAEAVGVPLVGDPFVLSRSADGSTPWLPDGLSHQYQRLTSRLGLSDPISTNCGTSRPRPLSRGRRRSEVAGRLGHADASVTLRVYAHALEARDRELAGMLGSVVLGPVNRVSKLDQADPPPPAQMEGYR